MANDPHDDFEHAAIKKRDALLIKATLSGNKNAFARLVSLYKRRIFLLGMSFFKNEADTDDFVQDVFIKAYTRLSSFRGASLFSTWLVRIAYNTALNSVGRRKEYLPLADEEPAASSETPEEKQLRKTAQRAVREAVSELPEKYAVCIDMYFSYDISYREISDITGFPVNTIKSHIFRAKKILRKKLEDMQ